MAKNSFGLQNVFSGLKNDAVIQLWSQHRDVLFPVVALMALGTFFVPLQPGVIDLLVVLNLVLTFIVATKSLTISTPIQLTSYPTILLITPVFRLCLSVSISRTSRSELPTRLFRSSRPLPTIGR